MNQKFWYLFDCVKAAFKWFSVRNNFALNKSVFEFVSTFSDEISHSKNKGFLKSASFLNVMGEADKGAEGFCIKNLHT